MQGSQKPDIFVSYANEDVHRVEVLVAALEAERWQVFWDQKIPFGEDWDSYIRSHLDAADVVIAVWSHLSVNSSYVKSEAGRAKQREVLIPVMIDPVDLPFGFDHLHTAGLMQWLATGGGLLPDLLRSSIQRKMYRRNNVNPVIPVTSRSPPFRTGTTGGGYFPSGSTGGGYVPSGSTGGRRLYTGSIGGGRVYTGGTGGAPTSSAGVKANPDALRYDVAMSFAGEDRPHARELAELLRANGLTVFYDEHERATLWGRNLYTHLSDVYQNKARYCLMFISSNYAQKLWTKREREAAQARAFRESREYILPLRLDDTALPGIEETVGYVDLRNTSYEEVARLVSQKLRQDRRDS